MWIALSIRKRIIYFAYNGIIISYDGNRVLFCLGSPYRQNKKATAMGIKDRTFVIAVIAKEQSIIDAMRGGSPEIKKAIFAMAFEIHKTNRRVITEGSPVTHEYLNLEDYESDRVHPIKTSLKLGKVGAA